MQSKRPPKMSSLDGCFTGGSPAKLDKFVRLVHFGQSEELFDSCVYVRNLHCSPQVLSSRDFTSHLGI